MEKAGCAINRDFFKVDRCDQPVLGGFRPDAGVVICHNNISCRTDMENMLTHELVHAYDHCRNKNMNWLDLKQHACSEIRASNLSGDCHWVRDPTLVPIRPRRRGGRRSLRTFAVVSLRPSPAFNPRHRRLSTPTDAYELHPALCMEWPLRRTARFVFAGASPGSSSSRATRPVAAPQDDTSPAPGPRSVTTRGRTRARCRRAEGDVRGGGVSWS